MYLKLPQTLRQCGITILLESLMAEWLGQASQGHEMYTVMILRSYVRTLVGSNFVSVVLQSKSYLNKKISELM